jgi:hypothetical protein
MIDYGRRGRKAVVDPEITRREIVSCLASGEYRNISFIHEVADSSLADITADVLNEAASPRSGQPAPICRPVRSTAPATCANTRRFERAIPFAQKIVIISQLHQFAIGLPVLHTKSIRIGWTVALDSRPDSSDL